MCRACDITQIYPLDFTIIKSMTMTLSRSPQCRVFSVAVMDEKSFSPLFPVGGGIICLRKCVPLTFLHFIPLRSMVCVSYDCRNGMTSYCVVKATEEVRC